VKNVDSFKADNLWSGKFFISANVHSSVAGKVAKIDVQLDATGYKTEGCLY
jgi:hypothetical protein